MIDYVQTESGEQSNKYLQVQVRILLCVAYCIQILPYCIYAVSKNGRLIYPSAVIVTESDPNKRRSSVQENI